MPVPCRSTVVHADVDVVRVSPVTDGGGAFVEWWAEPPLAQAAVVAAR